MSPRRYTTTTPKGAKPQRTSSAHGARAHLFFVLSELTTRQVRWCNHQVAAARRCSLCKRWTALGSTTASIEKTTPRAVLRTSRASLLSGNAIVAESGWRAPYVCFKHTLRESTFPSGRILAFFLTYNLFRALRPRARGLA